MKEETVFCFLAENRASAYQGLLLSKSIRAFGGRVSNARIFALVPLSADGLDEKIKKAYFESKIEIIVFSIKYENSIYPLGLKACAGAFAEDLLEAVSDNVIFLDSDSLLINYGEDLILKKNKAVGLRPVDKKLIGIAENEDSEFWKRLCDILGGQDFFEVETSAENEKIKAYFNCGFILFSPKEKLLSKWLDNFIKAGEDGQIQKICRETPLYGLFLHQAVFTCTVFEALNKDKIEILSPKVNFPLHLYKEYKADKKPGNISQLISLRYDTYFNNKNWRDDSFIAGPYCDFLIRETDF
jgi:hypothetical protein